MATLEQIKELRDQTQVSVALCKEAGKATRSVILYLNPVRKRWKALPKATVSSIPTVLSRLTSVVLTVMLPRLYGEATDVCSCVDR